MTWLMGRGGVGFGAGSSRGGLSLWATCPLSVRIRSRRVGRPARRSRRTAWRNLPARPTAARRWS